MFPQVIICSAAPMCPKTALKVHYETFFKQKQDSWYVEFQFSGANTSAGCTLKQYIHITGKQACILGYGVI